jgi:MFS transporter, DHA1 family, multidrug resistance protein
VSQGDSMKKSILITISFFFIQGIIHNLGHPVTPSFVRSLEIPDFMFGVFFASMSFGLMIGGPIWGVLGDNGKKKNFIIIGLLMYSIGQFGFGYAGNQYIMVFFRFFSGFGVVASATLLVSHIIEISDKKDRTKHLAYTAAAMTLGASIGYYLGGFIGTNETMVNLLNMTSYSKIFLIQALLNVLYTVYIYLAFKDSKFDIQTVNRPNMIQSLKEISHIRPSLLFFLISLTFMTIGAINLSKYIDVYFDELHYSPLQLGTFVFTTGIVSVLTSIFIVPIFAKFKKQILAIAVIQILSALIVLFVFRASNFLLVVYTIYMIYVIFKAVYLPLEQNFISLHAEEGKFGRVMGVRQSFLSIGMVIGPLLGGFLYERSALLLFDSSAFTFIIGVLLLGVVYILEKKHQQKQL